MCGVVQRMQVIKEPDMQGLMRSPRSVDQPRGSRATFCVHKLPLVQCQSAPFASVAAFLAHADQVAGSFESLPSRFNQPFKIRLWPRLGLACQQCTWDHAVNTATSTLASRRRWVSSSRRRASSRCACLTASDSSCFFDSFASSAAFFLCSHLQPSWLEKHSAVM